MAYVKLPEELRSWEVLLANGGASRFEFSIFAGEAIGVETRGGEMGDPPGASLHIRSQRGRRRFDFSKLPITFKPGEVAGVLAILPDDEDDGPILCVANLDTDQRVDFLSREPEVLRLMTDEPVDLRGAALGASDILGALARGVGLGLVAAVLAALVLTGLEVGGGAVGADPASFVVAAGAMLLGAAAPLLVGAGVGFIGFAWLLTRRALRLTRRARFQRELLDHVWRRAGDALGFVQDHAEAFRFSATIVASGGANSSETPPTEGEEVPGDEALKPSRTSRADVEDAQLLPIGRAAAADASVADCDPAPRAEPRVALAPRRARRPGAPPREAAERPAEKAAEPPKRRPPKLPSAWRRTEASYAAAERRRQEAERPAPETPRKGATRPRVEPTMPARRDEPPGSDDDDRGSALARAKPALQRTRPRGADVPTQHVAAARARLDISDPAPESANERLARLAEGLRAAARSSATPAEWPSNSEGSVEDTYGG